MKPLLTIRVEASPGSSITDAFKEGIELANKLHCFIKFSFNGVQCIANPGGNFEMGVAMYSKAIMSDDEFKFAIS